MEASPKRGRKKPMHAYGNRLPASKPEPKIGVSSFLLSSPGINNDIIFFLVKIELGRIFLWRRGLTMFHDRKAICGWCITFSREITFERVKLSSQPNWPFVCFPANSWSRPDMHFRMKQEVGRSKGAGGRGVSMIMIVLSLIDMLQQPAIITGIDISYPFDYVSNTLPVCVIGDIHCPCYL